jgi:methylmalonyl-CoA mutase
MEAAGAGRPRVFLANMGPVSQHKARADFSRGFFEVGGFEVISGDGFATPEAAADAAAASGAPIAVICSTDPTYPDLVPPFIARLREARPGVVVVLAGMPRDQVEAHRAAGVDEFIHIAANNYRILVDMMARTGGRS